MKKKITKIKKSQFDRLNSKWAAQVKKHKYLWMFLLIYLLGNDTFVASHPAL